MLSKFTSVSTVQPERLTEIESWHRHIPFAFAILDMLKPQVFVELGTHRGDSYSAFCQAVVLQNQSTHCYAVDTWQGDAHAGEYDDEIYEEFCEWHDPRYAAFSSLLRMTFDQALEQFADGSVDLLHIDGLHTYEAVKHDFESWLPKLSDRAVVLFHDTNVRYDDFGVWKLWGELEKQYPAFEFPYGFGLGVLAVGNKTPQAVLDFLAFARANSGDTVSFFYRCGDATSLLKKQNEIERLQKRLQNVGEQLEYARSVVVQRDQLLNDMNEHVQDIGCELSNVRQELAGQTAALQGQVASSRAQILDMQAQVVDLLRVQVNHRRLLSAQEYQLRMTLHSRLWRLRNQCMTLLGLGRRKVEYAPLNLLPISVDQKNLLEQARPAVTIIVPVYKGKDDTVACIESILASSYKLDAELVVINDASPEPELVDWLVSNSQRFTLLHNNENLGFVATVNRGMQLHSQRDVVLVNSDTVVANDWLDRLQQAAYSSEAVGSVTPFSNNATICSFPVFCEDNQLPANFDLARIDQTFAVANKNQTVEIPTAVGFCMYIRRDCLLDAGLFDAVRFGRGYGEENEFCMRSSLKGWKHLLAGDVFVYHKGGVSFAETQGEHQKKGHVALTQLFPEYDWVIQQHIAEDPGAHMRFAAEAALTIESNLPVVLLVCHGRGGGSQQHMEELALAQKGQVCFYLLQSEGELLSLAPLVDKRSHAKLYFSHEHDWSLLCDTLRLLDICKIHYHHFIDLPVKILDLPEELMCSYDITIHDFYLACPQITLTDEKGNYCGAPDVSGCNTCLSKRPVEGAESIELWRNLNLQVMCGAERIFVPSYDVMSRMATYFPVIKSWIWAPHTLREQEGIRILPTLQSDEPLRVLVMGALSIFKGADILESVALQARADRCALEFHLLGYGYRRLRSHPISALHVHGAYNEEEVQQLMARIDPHVVWFPGNCPETWSYTLSAALEAGLPVIATDIGVFPERLSARSWSWLLPANSDVETHLSCFENVRTSLETGVPPEPVTMSSNSLFENKFFDYKYDYFILKDGMAGQRYKEGKAHVSCWDTLYRQWKELTARIPESELLPQVSNPKIRRLLVIALKKGWLQPIILRMPAGIVNKLKSYLTR